MKTERTSARLLISRNHPASSDARAYLEIRRPLDLTTLGLPGSPVGSLSLDLKLQFSPDDFLPTLVSPPRCCQNDDERLLGTLVSIRKIVNSISLDDLPTPSGRSRLTLILLRSEKPSTYHRRAEESPISPCRGSCKPTAS